MEIRSFYRNQRELAETLSRVIDEYWQGDLPESEMIDNVIRIVDNNIDKVFVGGTGEFSTVLRQQCGKRRLEIVSKILNNKR